MFLLGSTRYWMASLHRREGLNDLKFQGMALRLSSFSAIGAIHATLQIMPWIFCDLVYGGLRSSCTIFWIPHFLHEWFLEIIEYEFVKHLHIRILVFFQIIILASENYTAPNCLHLFSDWFSLKYFLNLFFLFLDFFPLPFSWSWFDSYFSLLVIPYSCHAFSSWDQIILDSLSFLLLPGSLANSSRKCYLKQKSISLQFL